MAYYSDEIIEEVRSRSDVVDVISEYVHLQKRGSTYFGLCPFHNEKTASFSVTPSKQMFYCFGCHKGGNVFTFLMEYESLTFAESLQLLADRANITLPQQEYTAEQKKRHEKRDRIYEINRAAAGYFYKCLHSSHGSAALDYFKKRELSDETIKNFGLGYSDKYSDDLYKYLKSEGFSDDDLKDSGLITIDEAKGPHDKFWNRAMFPIMDMNSKVIAFGGRVIGEGEPKYLNSPETMIFDKSRNLFGLQLAKKTKRDQFILCEGYMDVISLHQAGFDNAVASLGTAFTPGQAKLLTRFGKQIYLSYDSDGAGVKAALRAIPILREYDLDCKIIDMNPYKDPDEFIKNLGAAEYESRIEHAENAFMFTIRMLERDFDLTDPTSKSHFMNEVGDRILEFETEIERENYMQAICDKYNFALKDVKELVASRAMKASGKQTLRQSELKTGINKRENRDEAAKAPMRLLLTWLVENPGIYPIISPYISPDDFSQGIYREVAQMLFEQFEAGEEINPAKISSKYTEPDDINIIAKLFNTTVGEITKGEDLAKALKETLVKIKEISLDDKKKNINMTDPAALKGIVDGKNQLEALRKLTLTL